MARTLIREAQEAVWAAYQLAGTKGKSPYEQLRAGIRAYLDFVSDRNRKRREERAAQKDE
jgi:hypothetical protein